MRQVITLARALVAFGAAVALAGCAMGVGVPVHTGPTELQFDSIPDSAEVWVNGELMGKTPLKLSLYPNQEYTVMYRKEGCNDLVVTLAIHAESGWELFDVTGFPVTPVGYEFDDKYPLGRLVCNEKEQDGGMRADSTATS